MTQPLLPGTSATQSPQVVRVVVDTDVLSMALMCDLSNYMAHRVRIKWPKSGVNTRLSQPTIAIRLRAVKTRRPPLARLAR